MGAAGDGWGLRGRSRSAPGSLRSGCVRGRGPPAVGYGRSLGRMGGVLMGLRLLAFPHLLPLLPPSQRLWAPLRCGVRVRCSRLPALRYRGGDAAVPAPGWGGGVTTHPAPPLPPPLGLCLCPDLTPPPTPGLHAPHPRCAARFCCTLGAACCDPPPPQPTVSRGGDARGHVRGAAECHRPPPHPPPSPQWGSDGQRGVCA